MIKPDFIVIDFETANNNHSPCQVGIVVCENGKITKKYSTLINLPKGEEIMFRHELVHGISNQHLIGKPFFKDIVKNIESYLKIGYLVIAHNASFDMRVLKKALIKNNIKPFNFNYVCSIQLLKNAFPNKFQKHNLEYLTNILKINFDHHDALSDCEATSEIILKCFGNKKDFEDALKNNINCLKSFLDFYNKID